MEIFQQLISWLARPEPKTAPKHMRVVKIEADGPEYESYFTDIAVETSRGVTMERVQIQEVPR